MEGSSLTKDLEVFAVKNQRSFMSSWLVDGRHAIGSLIILTGTKQLADDGNENDEAAADDDDDDPFIVDDVDDDPSVDNVGDNVLRSDRVFGTMVLWRSVVFTSPMSSGHSHFVLRSPHALQTGLASSHFTLRFLHVRQPSRDLR